MKILDLYRSEVDFINSVYGIKLTWCEKVILMIYVVRYQSEIQAKYKTLYVVRGEVVNRNRK
ncbi:MAG: hypothetical protein ACRDD7_06030 [Peptostreptococcaceae bacterium]